MAPDSTSYAPHVVRVPLVLAVLGLALASTGCLAPPEVRPPVVREEVSLLEAPHGAPGHFFLPWLDQSRRGFGALRWALTRNDFDKRRAPGIPVVANDGGVLTAHHASAKVTWVGHATFAVRDEDRRNRVNPGV